MSIKDLQLALTQSGYQPGPADGVWGPKTRAAVMAMFEDGPDTALTDADLRASALRMGISVAQIKAVCAVEANGAGFEDGFPKMLPEPHRFSKNTGGRFDQSHPSVSYKAWGTRPYPKTQSARFEQLMIMISLDPDAGFKSASYGKFQIMGENHALCGITSPMTFAYLMSRHEVRQLQAFELFLKNTGLLAKLRACGINADSCRPFCKGYNGTGYERNNYHTKLARAINQFGGS